MCIHHISVRVQESGKSNKTNGSHCELVRDFDRKLFFRMFPPLCHSMLRSTVPMPVVQIRADRPLRQRVYSSCCSLFCADSFFCWVACCLISLQVDSALGTRTHRGCPAARGSNVRPTSPSLVLSVSCFFLSLCSQCSGQIGLSERSTPAFLFPATGCALPRESNEAPPPPTKTNRGRKKKRKDLLPAPVCQEARVSTALMHRCTRSHEAVFDSS